MINIRMQHKEVPKLSPKIIVVGVGGAGGNAVDNMIAAGLEGVDFVVCNTDAQALGAKLCENKIQIGQTITNGLGAGARPEVGRESAEESLEQVLHYLEGANMVFITAGMGGGTGTGAAPVIAKAAREKGILTVGVVTKPFHFEGTYRMKMAEAGIEEMQSYVDTLIIIPNQNLFRIANEKTTYTDAFRMADGVLQDAVRSVTDLMVRPGHINLDFADIRSVMMEMGKAMMGAGEAVGEDRAEAAAEAAINNPLLDDVSMKGARGVIINVTGGHDMTLFEVDQACNRIRDEVDPNANIIIGSTFDENMEGVMRVSVVATGIDAEERARKPVPSTGASSWNARTASERKVVDRVQPNTGAAASSDAAPAATIPSYPVRANTSAASGGSFAAMGASSQVTAPVRKVEEAPATTYYAAETASYSEAPVATAGPSIYNDSFIPPKPVEVADQPRFDYSAPQFALSAARAQVAEAPAQTMASPGLNLRPPVPGAGNQQKRRTASLFERITSPLRHHAEEAVVENIHEQRTEQASDTQGEAQGEGAGAFHAGLRAPTRPQEQGSLNIDAPSVKADQPVDDELDIPAFLRRQAN